MKNRLNRGSGITVESLLLVARAPATYLAGDGESFLGRAGKELGVNRGEDGALFGGRRRLREAVELPEGDDEVQVALEAA